MRNIIVAVLGLVVPATPGVARAQERQAATVAFYPGALISLPAVVAQDQELFERNGLPVQTLSGSFDIAGVVALIPVVAATVMTLTVERCERALLAWSKGSSTDVPG